MFGLSGKIIIVTPECRFAEAKADFAPSVLCSPTSDIMISGGCRLRVGEIRHACCPDGLFGGVLR